MAFADDVRKFAVLTTEQSNAVFERAAELAFTSIVEGSPITGAPGQRVDSGFMKGSWRNIPIAPGERVIATPVAYAPIFEGEPYDPEGTQRPAGILSRGPSTVGGDHSVALTRLGWEKIVAAAVAEVVRG